MDERLGVVPDISVMKLDAGLYGFVVSHAGQHLFEEAGFTSITAALVAAAEDCGGFVGCQVTYDGIVAGTYAPDELAASSAAVAELCIENSARFAGH